MTLPRFIVIILLNTMLASIASSQTFVHIGEAIDYCNNHTLANIEGIWQFPDDIVSVLISQSSDKDGHYDVTVVESENGALSPGRVIGDVERTPDNDVYKFTFFGRERFVVKHNETFVATLKEKGETISLRKRHFNFHFNILSFLPYLRRLIYISTSDPVKELPVGLYKIYPSYDGNGSSRLKPRRL
ncbi:MAG: hypothetical protein NC201_05125 [Prevotella sp.]|nr:hypothetical protein [Bacteroides sp.]MCM1366613.1 hypothetical protein [Prevotella sp.]MCM1437290.1 hypothetical protein [Prevotella sp.]